MESFSLDLFLFDDLRRQIRRVLESVVADFFLKGEEFDLG